MGRLGRLEYAWGNLVNWIWRQWESRTGYIDWSVQVAYAMCMKRAQLQRAFFPFLFLKCHYSIVCKGIARGGSVMAAYFLWNE